MMCCENEVHVAKENSGDIVASVDVGLLNVAKKMNIKGSGDYIDNESDIFKSVVFNFEFHVGD